MLQDEFPQLFYRVLPHRDYTHQAPLPDHIRLIKPGQPVAALTLIADRQARQKQLRLLDCLL